MRSLIIAALLLPVTAIAQTLSLGYGTTRADTNSAYLGYEGSIYSIYYGIDVPIGANLREVNGATTTTTTHYANLRAGYNLLEMGIMDLGLGASSALVQEEVVSGGSSSTTMSMELAAELNAIFHFSPTFKGYARATSDGVYHIGASYGF